MAKAAEKPQKQTVEPEHVPEALKPIADNLEANWRVIAIVAAGALLLLGGVAIALQVQSHGRELAAQSVGSALAEVDKPIVADLPASDAAPKPEAKPDTKPAGKTEAKAEKPAPVMGKDEYASETDRQTAIAAKAQQTLDRYGSGSPAGRVALLTLADARYKLGQYPDAVDAYGKLLGAAPEGETLRAFAQVGLAYALLGEGKKDEAINAAKGLIDHPPAGFGRDLGLLAEGKIAEDTHQLDVAKLAYKQLYGEAPDSAAGREASERLTMLGDPPIPAGGTGAPGGIPGLAVGAAP